MLRRSRFSSILPEAGLTVIIGIVAGSLVYFFADEEEKEQKGDGDVIEALLTFDSKAFFVFLLPPIIFNSGYQISKGKDFVEFLCYSRMKIHHTNYCS